MGDDSASSSTTGSDFVPELSKPRKSLMKTGKSKKATGRKMSVSFAANVNIQNISNNATVMSTPGPSTIEEDKQVSVSGQNYSIESDSSSSSLRIIYPKGDFGPDDSIRVPMRQPRKRTLAAIAMEAKKQSATEQSPVMPEDPNESIKISKRKPRRKVVPAPLDLEKVAKNLQAVRSRNEAKKQEKETAERQKQGKEEEVKLPENPEESIVISKRKVRRKIVPPPVDLESIARQLQAAKEKKELQAKEMEINAKEMEINANDERESQMEGEKGNAQANVIEGAVEELRGPVVVTDRLSMALEPPEHTQPGIQISAPVYETNVEPPAEDQPDEPRAGTKRPSRIPRAVEKRHRPMADSGAPTGKAKRPRGEESKNGAVDVKSTSDQVVEPKPVSAADGTFVVDATESDKQPNGIEVGTEKVTPVATHLHTNNQGSMSPAYPEALPVEMPVQTAFGLMSRLTPAKAVTVPDVESSTTSMSSVAAATLPSNDEAAHKESNDDDETLPFDADTGDGDESVELPIETGNQQSNLSKSPAPEARGGDDEEGSYEEEEMEHDTPEVSDKSLFAAAQKARSTRTLPSIPETPGPSRLRQDAGLGLNEVDQVFNQLKKKRAQRKRLTKKPTAPKRTTDIVPRKWVKQLGEFYLQARLPNDTADVLHKGVERIFLNLADDFEAFCEEKGSEAFTDWTHYYEFFRRQNLVENYNEYCGFVHRYLPSHKVKLLIPRVVDGRTVPHYDPKIIEEIDMTLNETRLQRTQPAGDDDDSD